MYINIISQIIEKKMTVFVPSNIPGNVNTLEKLACWVGLALARLNPTLSSLELTGQTPEKVAQVSFFRAADNTLRLNVRLSIPIDEQYASLTRKFWENAQDLSQASLPTNFTTN